MINNYKHKVKWAKKRIWSVDWFEKKWKYIPQIKLNSTSAAHLSINYKLQVTNHRFGSDHHVFMTIWPSWNDNVNKFASCTATWCNVIISLENKKYKWAQIFAQKKLLLSLLCSCQSIMGQSKMLFISVVFLYNTNHVHEFLDLTT